MRQISFFIWCVLLFCLRLPALAQLRFEPAAPVQVNSGTPYTISAKATFAAQSITIYINKNGSSFFGNGGGGSGQTPITVVAAKETSDVAVGTDAFVNYDVTAQVAATQGGGTYSIGTVVRIVAANTPPTITWTLQPAPEPNNPRAGQPFQIRAQANDADGNLTDVRIFGPNMEVLSTNSQGNGSQRESDIVTYTAATNGIVTFYADAFDTKTSVRSSLSVKVGVANVVPTIYWPKTPTASYVGETLKVQPEATDPDGSVVTVRVWRDLHDNSGPILVSTTPGAEVSYIPLSPGTITYSAQASDNNGGDSTVISFNVPVYPLPAPASSFAWGTIPSSSGPGTPTASSGVGAAAGSVSVDNHGSANYVIPLKVPPGRSGVEPNLVISYNSATGNGPLGVGWNLSTGFPQAITRGRSISARDGIVRGVNFDSNDKYYLDGKRLIRVGGTEGAPGSSYRTEVDSFATIEAVGSGSNIETFVMKDKGGRSFYFGKYGSTTDGYQNGVLSGDMLAYTYALKHVEDSLGNALDFNYTGVTTSLAGNNVPLGEYVLGEILYTANASLSIAPAGRVTFHYNTSSVAGSTERLDRFVSYLANRSFAHSRRLDSINVEFGAGARSRVAYYELDYSYAPNSGRTRLMGVTPYLLNSTSNSFESFPKTTVAWTDSSLSASWVNNVSGGALPNAGSSLGAEQRGYRPFVFGDFNGDGIEDYVDARFGLRVYLGTPSGFVNSGLWINSMPPSFDWNFGISVYPADLNGDGKKDLILADKECVRIYAVVSSGTSFLGLPGSGNPSTPTLITDTQIPFDDPPGSPTGGNHLLRSSDDGSVGSRVVVGDFNGDGKDDLLLHGYDGYLYTYTNLINQSGAGNAPYERSTRGTGISSAQFYYDWNLVLAGTRIFNYTISPMPGDLNGDGLTDYAWLETNRQSPSNSTLGFDSLRQLHVRLAQPGGGFSPDQVIDAATCSSRRETSPEDYTNIEHVLYSVLAGDFNGDGLTDFLTRSTSGQQPERDLRWRLFTSRGTGADGSYKFDRSVTPVIPYAVLVNGKALKTFYSPMTNIAWQNSQLYVGPGALVNIYDSATLYAAHGHITSTLGDSMAALDVNHDGLTDFVWYYYEPGSSAQGWYVLYSNGSGFGNPTKLSGAPWDNLAGLVIPISSGINDGNFVSVSSGPDVNGDGVSDYTVNLGSIFRDTGLIGWAVQQSVYGDLVSNVVDGLGRSTGISYKVAKDPLVYTPGAAAVSYPIRELRSSAPVVSDVYQDSGDATNPAQFSYQYSGNYLDLSGRGSLGFHSFITLDRQTNVLKYQFLTQSFPMTGLVSREQTYRYWEAGGQTKFRLISTHDNTVVFDGVVNTAGTRFGSLYPFISKAIESRWEDSDTPHFTLPKSKPTGTPDPRPEDLFPAARPAGAHITITAQSWFDNQPLTSGPQTTLPGVTGYNPSDANGFPGTSTASGTTTANIFNSLPGKITFGNLRKLTTDFGDGFTETVTTNYKTAPIGTNLTGLVDTVATTVTSPGYGAETAPSKTYTYEGNTPLVKTELVDASAATPADASLSLTTTYTRDARGRITSTSISSPDTTVGSYTVSSVTAYHDTFDLPTGTSDAYGHVTTTAYDSIWGLPRTVTDPAGVQLSYSYDGLGRVTNQTRTVEGLVLATDTAFSFTTSGASDWKKTQTVSGPVGLSVSSAYAVRTTATVKPATTTYYDRLGRQIRVIKEGYAGQTATTDTLYNPLGQVVAVSNPYASGSTPLWTTTTYDVLGRVATVTAPVGTVTTNTYEGRTTKVTVSGFGGNGLSQTNKTLVDAKGRTVSVWNADNTSTTPSLSFGLDGFGRMRTTTLKGQTQSISATYDALGRQLTLNDPDKGLWSYVNNALGQVIRQTDAKGTITTTAYDRLGRALTRTTTEASGPVETASWFYYDSSPDPARHAVALGTKGWNLALQREESTTTGAPGYPATPTSTVHYYDTKGRPAIDLTTIDGKWFYTYTDYDAYSRVNQVRHYWRPGDHELPADAPYVWRDFGYAYTYDSNSYLLSLTDSANRTWWSAAISTGYDHLDRPVLVQKGSAYWTQRTYRAEDGVLTGIATGPRSGASVSATVQNLSYGYDGLGNLTARDDALKSLHETYGYDVLNRLTKLGGTTLVSYLDNGNIDWKKDVTGGQSQSYSYDSTRPHAVSSAWGYSLGYDANGNMVTRTGGGQTWSTVWTGFDKPRWLAKNNVGSEFHYNASRSRVMHLEFDQVATGKPSHYSRKRIYGLGSTLEVDYLNVADITSSAWKMDRVRIYVPGPEGIAGTMEFAPSAPFDRAERALVYHYDHLGSIERITPFGDTSAVVATDETGSPARYSYDAWGQRRNADSWAGAPTTTAKGGHADLTPRGFTSHEMLDDLGLVHMNGRIYDPLLGRFLSADIVVQAPGSLQSYNRYSYVMNNPLTMTDPTGFWSWSSFGKGVLIGAVSAAVVAAAVVAAPVVIAAAATTLGASAATAATAATVAAVTVNTAATVATAYTVGTTGTEIVTGREVNVSLKNGVSLGRELSDNEVSEKAGNLVGGVAGGVAGARITGAAIQARADQGQITDLISSRVEAGKGTVGEATFANGRTGNGPVTAIAESVPGGGGAHAEPQIMSAMGSGGGPRTIAVDQVPCPTCGPQLAQNLPPGSRVIVPENPVAPGGSPKTAALNAVKGGEVRPRTVLDVPPSPAQQAAPLTRIVVPDTEDDNKPK